MKRLFCVKNSDGSVITAKMVPHSLGYHITHGDGPLYFEKKEIAKALRDLMGEQHHISRGPDHMGKHGNKTLAKFRRQPK